MTLSPFQYLTKELVSCHVTAEHLPLSFVMSAFHQETFISPVVVQFPQDVGNLPGRDTWAKMIPGYAFHGMSLVQNHRVIVGQYTHSLTSQGQITEKQSVVDDDDLSMFHSPPRTKVKARLV